MTNKLEYKQIEERCYELGVTSTAQIIYVIATFLHETNHTLKPVKEGYWVKSWNRWVKGLRYYPFYGRGFVQLTWLRNYKLFGELLGIDLVGNPDLALDKWRALDIGIIGMRDGLFTGKKLNDYINDKKIDYVNARRIINGKDKANKIALLCATIKLP